jgi:hypothetical protein
MRSNVIGVVGTAAFDLNAWTRALAPLRGMVYRYRFSPELLGNVRGGGHFGKSEVP